MLGEKKREDKAKLAMHWCTGERNYMLFKDLTNGKFEVCICPPDSNSFCFKVENYFNALIVCLKYGPEQCAKTVWLQQGTFACHCEWRNVFCEPGKSTDPVNAQDKCVKCTSALAQLAVNL